MSKNSTPKNINDLPADVFAELFDDLPLNTTCLEGEVEINLITPGEPIMRVICEEVLAESIAASKAQQKKRGAKPVDDEAAGGAAGILVVQKYGHEFVEGHKLRNEQWQVLMRRSSPSERHVIFQYINECIIGWIGVGDDENDEEAVPEKKR